MEGEDGAKRAATRLAEAVRFELTNGCPLPVFKTGAIDHSATLPGLSADARWGRAADARLAF